MKLKILLITFTSLLIILTMAIFQWVDVVHVPCVNNMCPLGGVCTKYNQKNLCLNGKNVNDLCEKYCGDKKCEIGISEPIVINCK